MTIPGEWELKPLAIEGAPTPAGGQFHFFPYVYLEYPIWVQSGITAFWSNFDSKDKDSTLYSIKDGRVTRILAGANLCPSLARTRQKWNEAINNRQ